MDSFSRAGSMIVTGLPSARISATPGGRRQHAQGDDEVGDPALGDEQAVDQADQPRRRRPPARHGSRAGPRRRVHLAEDDRAQGHRRGDRQVDAGGGDHEGLADRQDDQDRGGDAASTAMLPGSGTSGWRSGRRSTSRPGRPGPPSRPRLAGVRQATARRRAFGRRSACARRPACAVDGRSAHLMQRPRTGRRTVPNGFGVAAQRLRRRCPW